MSKLVLLLIAAVVVGVAGGVIEVTWHPDKLSALPGNIMKLAQDGSLIERGRSLVTSLKRTGEFWLIRDERQRLEIATTYISSDADRLNQLLEDQKDAAAILPQAQLLAGSIKRAATVAEKSSVDTVASLQAETKTAFSEAADTVQRLAAKHAEYKDLEQKFADIVAVLAKQIGSLKGEPDGLPAGQAGDVAGAKDAPASTASPTIPAIQLNF